MENNSTLYKRTSFYGQENSGYIDRVLSQIKAKNCQTVEEQCQYIELCEQLRVDYSVHPIPSELLLTETMLQTVRKRPQYIHIFPKEKLTYEVCYETVKNTKERMGAKVKAIPKHFFDYNLCFLIIKLSPRTIRTIPVKLITQELIDDLKANGVDLKSQRSYIEECFKINNKTTSELATNSSVDNNQYTHLKQPLDEFTSLLTSSVVNMLENKNIRTLEELFIAYDNGSFSSILSRKNGTCEIVMKTTKLLKCKFCDTDPEIDENQDVADFLKDIGASVQVHNCIVRWNYNQPDNKFTTARLFELVKSGKAETVLSNIRNMGPQYIEELVESIKILIDFKERKKSEESINDKDNLIALNAELSRLLAERSRIENEINNVLVRIQNKTNVESKGGVLK